MLRKFKRFIHWFFSLDIKPDLNDYNEIYQRFVDLETRVNALEEENIGTTNELYRLENIIEMNNLNQDDGIKVTENKDGTFTLEWDPCDSRWSVLNDMTSEQISAMIIEQVKLFLEEHNEQTLECHE